MQPTLSRESLAGILQRLDIANQTYNRQFPGPRPDRQPVHVVYGGGHLFRAETPRKLGELARAAMLEHAPGFVTFAKALGIRGAARLPDDPAEAAALEAAFRKDPQGARRMNEPAWLAHAVHSRVLKKLETEPVEDFRLDYEDGYGNRAEAEEDAHAVQGAQECAKAHAAGILPPFFGIRIKPFTPELVERSIRTLDLFLTTLLGQSGGKLPPGFIVTLAKILTPEQVGALADVLDVLESRLHLAPRSIPIELMIETTQSVIGPHGEATTRACVDQARGRCIGAHFGTYDYTAGCGITAAYQGMTHPSCEFARHMMQVTLAGTGVFISDGATNIMPIGPHAGGSPLTTEQLLENRAVVHRAWRIHFEQARDSIMRGFYQGWDLHPAQLPSRYAAVFSFFLEGMEAASARLRNFMEKLGQATLVGDVFDDAATGQGLLNYFLRGMASGAISEEEALATGLTLEELRSRSFVKILKGRKR